MIHLATAMAVTLHQLEERGLFGLDLLDLISMPHVVKYIVELADRYAGMIVKGPRLSIKPDELIRVRCA